jgi:hypothetical protein
MMDVEAILDWNDAGRVQAQALRAHPLAAEQRDKFRLVTRESMLLNGAAALLDR